MSGAEFGTRSRGKPWNRVSGAEEWVDLDSSFISRRYDRLAGLIPFFDWLLFQPPGFRRKAVDRLDLKPGDRALEIGCGTGRNLPFLQQAVGPTGRVYGVDFSPGMLAKAHKLRERQEWSNVELIECDAADYVAPEPLDGILFGLSYNTMPHHLTVLHQAWSLLRPGGRLVIMDAKLPPGLGGELVRPFGVWLMKRTMLGNPYIRPWKDLARFTDQIEMEEFMLGAYYVCRGIKP